MGTSNHHALKLGATFRRALLGLLTTAILLIPATASAAENDLLVWTIDPGKLKGPAKGKLIEEVKGAISALDRWVLAEPRPGSEQALGRIAKQCKGLDPDCAARAADATGVRVVVMGAVSGRGKRLQLRLLLVDIENRGAPARAAGAISVKRLEKDVAQVVAKLSAAAQPTIGSILVTTNVAGAAIRLDGQLVGRSPLPTPMTDVPVGPHALTVAHPDYETYSAEVEVRPGAEVRLSAELVPLAPPSPSPGPATSSEAEPTPTKVVTTQEGGATTEVIMANEAGSASETDAPAAETAEHNRDEERVFPLSVGVEVGGAFSQVLSKLGSSFNVGIELAFLLPFLDQRLAVYGNLFYSQPNHRETVADPRLASNETYRFNIVEQLLVINLGALFRIFAPAHWFNVYGQIGLRLDMQRSMARGSTNVPFLENRETATTAGIHGALGGEIRLGPGAVAIELDLSASDLSHTVTGNSTAGALGILAGYHFLF